MADPLFAMLGVLHKAGAVSRTTAIRLTGAPLFLLADAKAKNLIRAVLIPREGSMRAKRKAYFLTIEGHRALGLKKDLNLNGGA